PRRSRVARRAGPRARRHRRTRAGARGVAVGGARGRRPAAPRAGAGAARRRGAGALMPRVRAHLRPWQAVVVTAVASVLGGALATAAALASRGRGGTARRLLLVSLPLGAAGMASLALLRTPWQTIAWPFLAFNLAGGTGLALLLSRWSPPPEAEPAPPGTVRQAAWLAPAGAP